MSVLQVHEVALQELARQAVLQEYRLPYGEADGLPVEKRDYETPPELLNLVKLAVRVSGMDMGVINIITADQQHQIAAVGVDAGVCSREDSMCSKVFTSGAITALADASRDPRFAENPFVNGGIAEVRSYASVPLVTTAGYALGALCVFSLRVHPFTADQREGLEILARQVVEVLELQFKTRQLVEALEVVRRSNEDLAGFAARVSHDLKNPLTAILGYAELSEQDDEVEPSGPAARYFSIIRGSASRMLTTVEEVLAFSRIGGAITRRPVRLSTMMNSVLQDVLPLTTSYDAVVTVQDAQLDVDQAQVTALLQNLVSNAIKYSTPDTPPRIEVIGHVGETQVLRIIDHGKGIDPEDRQRVLEPLVRLQRDGDPAGSGIGLATCARIATAHDGLISITGTPGGGTTVTVDLGPAS
ncbi:GAF domain-containing protein [Arthrobacter cheniae]|jgi:signal transduction histidine kinase|uniref:Sensor-like histidine kinase SenX3 n=1 Tax=Arthrobacter cheniae TaxID=1258888 RepID=A0A3A5M8F3_9MICC|nr:GAF domain-containing sensor histidine kinase [Arthrobacter cheniae]RJT83095.1 GAF domain-containing protein [Arthrobacter cheniae]